MAESSWIQPLGPPKKGRNVDRLPLAQWQVSQKRTASSKEELPLQTLGPRAMRPLQSLCHPPPAGPPTSTSGLQHYECPGGVCQTQPGAGGCGHLLPVTALSPQNSCQPPPASPWQRPLQTHPACLPLPGCHSLLCAPQHCCRTAPHPHCQAGRDGIPGFLPSLTPFVSLQAGEHRLHTRESLPCLSTLLPQWLYTILWLPKNTCVQINQS